MQLPNSSNICAAIITYHPDAGLPDRVDVIARQVDKILIVDNGSNQDEYAVVEQIISRTGAHAKYNPSNIGVAAALNQAMAWAREHGYAWLLTMDQDSLLSESAVSIYAQVLESIGDPKVAILGANFKDTLTGVPLVPADSFGGAVAIDIKNVISSGNLMSIEAADIIGKFREDFFIDHVDDEYCLRAWRMGFRVMLTRKALIEHTIGSPKWHSFLGKRLISSHKPPERRYYGIRNFVAMARQYWRNERPWFAAATKTHIKQIILMLMFEDRRAIKLWYVLRGVTDGLLGRMGPLKTSHFA